uniref:Uncharacterized protein n=1 Tax=Oryza brachyantha TaxID=4533 RepID=J3MMD3_ORYBR
MHHAYSIKTTCLCRTLPDAQTSNIINQREREREREDQSRRQVAICILAHQGLPCGSFDLAKHSKKECDETEGRIIEVCYAFSHSGLVESRVQGR